MKMIKQTILFLLAFGFAFLLLMVVVNLPVFDEELLPEVQAIKDIKAQPFGSDNAYPAILAMNGPPGKTLSKVSTELRFLLNQKITAEGIDYLNKQEYQEYIGKNHENSWRKQYEACNSRRDLDCMAQMVEQVNATPIQDARLLEQLNRYQDLIKHTNYSDVTQLNFDAPLVAFSPVMDVKRLYLAQAMLQLPSEYFLKTVIQDMQFWRMVLQESHLLITKMVTASTLRDSIGTLSVAISNDRISFEQLQTLQNQLQTLNETEIDMGETFKYEFKYGMSMIDQAEGEEPIGTSRWINFFQPQATHNLKYKHMVEPLMQVSQLNTRHFYQHMNSGDAALDSPASWSPTMIYNPTGKQLVSYALPAYSAYFGRIHDLNGMLFLLKLQIEIALNPDQNVEHVVNNSAYTNPYTLEPMTYNKQSHSIYFQCMDKHSVCELGL